MTDIKPLACPFCGNAGKVHHEDDEYFRNEAWSVGCDVCQYHTNFFDSRKSAVQAWNHRVPTMDNDSAEFKAEVHEVSEFLRELKSVLKGRHDDDEKQSNRN